MSLVRFGVTSLLLLVSAVRCLENGLARTPPMGWLAWERFRCITDCDKYPKECISEDLFRSMADVMAADGYKELGYEYVIIDDCWLEKERDTNGKLQADKKRFPSGIRALADYVHSKGLKFGIYEDFGTHTCAGYPGVIDHLEQDANTFAEWQVDYVKLDGCYADPKDMPAGYPAFGRFLNKTGRPMIYSCSWPVYEEESGIAPNFEAMKESCNLWRNYDDIDDSLESIEIILKYFAEQQDRIAHHAGPGHWNDPDMLIIGNYGLTIDQSQQQMALWAVLAAPLLMSADLRTIRPEFKEILQNRKVITVNQDPLGIQGRRNQTINKIEVWTRPITPVSSQGAHSFVVAFASRRTDGAPYHVSVSLSAIGLDHPAGYLVTNLFDDSALPFKVSPGSPLEARVNPSGVIFYKAEVL